MNNWCLTAKENALAAVLSAVCLSVPCENGAQRSSAGRVLSVGAQSISTLQCLALGWLENPCCRVNWIIHIKCYR